MALLLRPLSSGDNSMIRLKTPQEIDDLAAGGKILAGILRTVAAAARPGVTPQQLDELAERLIREAGGRPAFKHYREGASEPPYPGTLCVSVNDQVVHAPPTHTPLRSGDIVGIDIGMEYRKLFTDMAVTVPIGTISHQAQQLLDVTREALQQGIAQVAPGKTVADIGRAVQTYVEEFGFSVVKDLVGHGVGHAVHEDPRVPNFVAVNQPTVELVPGLVIAIEPMVNIGSDKVEVLEDEWTIATVDGSLSAHFEHTVAVTADGYRILTLE